MEDSIQHSANIFDLYATMEELHGYSSQEIKKLLEDSHNMTMCLITQKVSLIKADMERVSWQFPLYLLACIFTWC